MYWDNVEYAGFGAGAHGYALGNRYANIGPIKKYMDALLSGELPINSTHEVTAVERMEEEMFLGLRKVSGIDKKQFEDKFGKTLAETYGQVLSKHIDTGSIIDTNDCVALTRKGRFIGNEIFQSFLME